MTVHHIRGRKPWIMFDRVLTASANRTITSKNISQSDYFIRGHFEAYSIYPGLLLAEGIIQSAGFGPGSGEIHDLSIRFVRPVVPGDVVIYDTSKIDAAEGTRIEARGTVEGELVVRLLCTVVSREGGIADDCQ